MRVTLYGVFEGEVCYRPQLLWLSPSSSPAPIETLQEQRDGDRLHCHYELLEQAGDRYLLLQPIQLQRIPGCQSLVPLYQVWTAQMDVDGLLRRVSIPAAVIC